MARLLFWVGLIVIAVATLGPIGLRPETSLPPQVERFGAFFVIAALMSVGYPRRRVIGILALVVVAGLLEMLQNDVPGRHGRFVDFDAKILGVLVGFVAGLIADQLGRSTATSREPG